MSDRMLNVRIDERTMLALADRANENDSTVSQVAREAIDMSLGIVRTNDGFQTYAKWSTPTIPTSRKELYHWYSYFVTHDGGLSMAIDFTIEFAGGFLTKINTVEFQEDYVELSKRVDLEVLAKDVMREVLKNGEAFLSINTEGKEVKSVDFVPPVLVEVRGDFFITPRYFISTTEELKRIFAKNESFNGGSKVIKESLVAGGPIEADPDFFIHVKNGSSNEAYGTSPIKALFSQLLNKHSGKHNDGVGIYADVFMNRLNAFRDKVAVVIDRVLAVQAELIGDENPPTIYWQEGADAEQKWAIAKAWRDGVISDNTFAVAIGAKDYDDS